MNSKCDGAEELGLVGEPKGVVYRDCADTDPVLWTVIFKNFLPSIHLKGHAMHSWGGTVGGWVMGNAGVCVI